MVEGSDPALKDTYVIFGAHLDHVGYARGTEAKGQVNNPIAEDRIWNGADDDGSGSIGLLGIAKAFATGPRPRRSVVFVWHAGEEAGLLGSRYMVELPGRAARPRAGQFNIDMIGRNRDDNPSEENTVFVIGADRISTDLHNLLVETNARSPEPMTLDFEFNDPADVEQLLHAERPLQLRLEGHPDRVLLHRHAPRLPRQLGHRGQDPVPEARAGRAI